ncbi:type VI secretion system lipoprotein TssJ [Vibrio sp. SCSIO 43136]|nr:type VI secretion system lipoprotein TssJ [Vibrio sp. SCSIO 43136]
MLLITACSSSGDAFTPPVELQVYIEAGNEINVFDDDKARPVVVRVYQLSDVGSFLKADFLSLYSSDQTVLAGSLIDSRTLDPVLPGEKRSLKLEVQQQTKYLGLLAEFADYDGATTTAHLALSAEPQENPIYIRITSGKVEISQPVDSAWWKVF